MSEPCPNYCSNCGDQYFYEIGVHSDEYCFKCISRRVHLFDKVKMQRDDAWDDLNDKEIEDELEEKEQEMTKPKTAAQKKAETKLRKPRLVTEDYGILTHALEALVREEENKEIEFAEKHVRGEDGEDFKGTYSELAALYQTYDRPMGSVMRTKAMALLEKIKPHATK